MKHILIPTDFSDNAWTAIQYGTELFKKTKCTFYILHVHPISNYSSGDAEMLVSADTLEELYLKDANKNFGKLLKKIESLPLNHKHNFRTEAVLDFLTERIKKEIKEKHIDMIIMGTKGASGLKAFTIGSNTGNVITKVKCPVLAVPENTKFEKPKEITFPTDYNLNYDIKVLDRIKEFVVMNSTTLRVLYISKVGEELTGLQTKNKELLHDYFSGLEHSFHKVTGEQLETAVQCFTESRDIDMIVMVAKNLNFLQRILFRPTVEKISYHTHVPFLVLHE